MAATAYDRRGIPIERGDVVRVHHFTDGRRKKHFMYKQCLGVGSYRNSDQKYVFFSHLNFIDEIGSREVDGPYHERIGEVLRDYEIIQSIWCDHEHRPRQQESGEGST